MRLIGSKNGDAPTPEEAAAKRASDREAAAHRIQQYLLARVLNPQAARRMPEIADLQSLLDERKRLLEFAEDSKVQQARTLAVVMHSLGVDRVELSAALLEEVEGCSIRQSVEGDTIVLELVRPTLTGEKE